MIQSFANKATEAIFHGRHHRSFPTQHLDAARRKLDLLNAAASEADLRVPPGNHFEHLIGDKKGYCSIRINRQWRVEFRFAGGNAYDVRISNHYKD